jgi:MFS family permease
MRHATPAVRPFLFGIGTALSPASALVGTALAGILAGPWGEQAPGMKKVLLLSAGISALGAVLFLLIREARAPQSGHEKLQADPGTVFRLGLPLAVIGLGAGLTIPFINLYFDERLNFGTQAVSAVFSVAQVFTLLAFLASPLLARRFGGVRTVVACQLLSIPFFLVMALTVSPTLAIGAFLARHALMNMAGPVNSQFAMEVVPAHKRVLTNGLREIAWNGAFFVGTTVGGWVISRRLVGDGYTASMFATIGLYIAGSVIFYAFWRKSTALKPASAVAPVEPAEVAP